MKVCQTECIRASCGEAAARQLQCSFTCLMKECNPCEDGLQCMSISSLGADGRAEVSLCVGADESDCLPAEQ
jgi:hypothetical protein